MSAGRRLDTCGASAGAAGIAAQLVDAIRDDVRSMVRAEVAQLVREAFERDARAEWLTPRAACAFAGWRSTATLRAHVAAGELTRGRGGRVRRDELERFLAHRAAPARSRSPAAVPTAPVVVLRREKARRAARQILASVGGRAE